jgi:uncharacterized protein
MPRGSPEKRDLQAKPPGGVSTKSALGAVVTRVPAVSELGKDPVEIIQTGDHVAVDGHRGIVTVTPAR